MIGFETIGNATCTVFDGKPVLATDPWLSGSAYFGSWGMPYQIPKEQKDNILKCKYIWISHGHPDHLDSQSMLELKGKEILLGDHVGNRIKNSLEAKGFKVSVLPDRKWVELSPNIKVYCIADYYQDSVLLVDVGGVLLVNLNDCSNRGWLKSVKKIIKQYKESYLLKLFGWGDVDMNNFFNEDGSRFHTLTKFQLGRQITYWAELYGVKYVVPFSSTHCYQRDDSAWGNEYVCSYDDYYDGLVETTFQMLKPFIKVDLKQGLVSEINPLPVEHPIVSSKEFGDDWSELLEHEEEKKVVQYFKNIETLKKYFDFINIKVGGRTTRVEYTKSNFSKGITFEAPRGSLMTSIDFEVFDDMLIGNFMKTTLHGVNYIDFTRHFAPYVGKIADNGLAKSEEEVQNYFSQYRKRALLEFFMHQFESESERRFRTFFNKDSMIFKLTKNAYKAIHR